MSIEVKNLNKRFGQTVVCDNLNLDIPDGELVAAIVLAGAAAAFVIGALGVGGRWCRPAAPRAGTGR